MSIEDNKAVVAAGSPSSGEPTSTPRDRRLAAPDIRFEYSLHAPLRGREQCASSLGFRAAFPDPGSGARPT